MRITFKRVDDFTWEAQEGNLTAEIVHEYFGSYDPYVLYIDGRRIWSYDKLNEARRAGKEELARRVG